MEPARLVITLTVVLALAGIGGAFRACGSLARSGSRVGSRAVTVPAHLPRVTAYPRVTTSAGSWAGGTVRRSAAAGVLAEDAVKATPRASKAGSALKHVGGQADSLLDIVDGDDDKR